MPYVRPSVRDVDVTLGVFVGLIRKLRVFAPQRHNIGNLALGKHPQNSGGIGVGVFSRKPAISLKRGIRPSYATDDQ